MEKEIANPAGPPRREFDVWEYTEAWRCDSKGIEQKGDDDFLVPKKWLKTEGRVDITAKAWFQAELPSGMTQGQAGDEMWGTLHGMNGHVPMPANVHCLERTWAAIWQGRTARG